MAYIKEFSALRFTEKAGDPAELCCPPYDIISAAEKQDFLNKNPYNIIKLELPEPSDAGYLSAKETFEKWLSDGILAVDSKPAIYIYEEKFSVKNVNYAFKGFVCNVKLAQFSEGVILPHEETLSKAKTDRFNLLNSTGCSFSQIYSLYSDGENEISPIIEELSSGAPHTSFTDGASVKHSLWIAEKSDKTAELCAKFADKTLYIADGHHRYETALNYQKYVKENGLDVKNSDFVMMFLVNMENKGLVVFPTHRIVRGLDNFDGKKLLSDSEKYFTVTKLDKNDAENYLDAAYEKGEKAFVYFDKDYYGLKLKDITVMDKLFPEKSEALRRLDVSVLHSLVLEELLGIDKENMAQQINLTYTRDIKEAQVAVKDGANCCFLLNPTRVSEISEVAKAHEKMPQKSTYFYPKLITGLVMNKVR